MYTPSMCPHLQDFMGVEVFLRVAKLLINMFAVAAFPMKYQGTQVITDLNICWWQTSHMASLTV